MHKGTFGHGMEISIVGSSILFLSSRADEIHPRTMSASWQRSGLTWSMETPTWRHKPYTKNGDVLLARRGRGGEIAAMGMAMAWGERRRRRGSRHWNWLRGRERKGEERRNGGGTDGMILHSRLVSQGGTTKQSSCITAHFVLPVCLRACPPVRLPACHRGV